MGVEEELVPDWKEIGDLAERFKIDPKHDRWLNNRLSAYQRFRSIFRKDMLDHLTSEQFSEFLRGDEEKAWWTGLERSKSKILANMDGVRSAIEQLQDSSLTGEERLSDVLIGGRMHVEGFGRNLASAILHVCDESDSYGVWNDRSEKTLRNLQLIPDSLPSDKKEAYSIVNSALNSLKRFSMSLAEADIFVYWVDEYSGIATEPPQTFAFTDRDFESCTGEADDAVYLNRRFKDLRTVVQLALGNEFRDFKSYTAKPFDQPQPQLGQKGVKYRDHMWIGFADPHFDRPQSGIQFQVNIDRDKKIGIEVWIDRRAQKSREYAKEIVMKNKEYFAGLLQSLPGYDAALRVGYSFEKKTVELSEDSIEEFISHMTDRNTHVHIGKTLGKNEALAAGPNIVSTIATTFKELLPIYSILVPKPSSLEKQIWIEKTDVEGEPLRQSGEDALGKALWSPQTSEAGADIYKNMRLINKGDIILHLVDRKNLVGVSIVDKEYDSSFKCLPNTKWAGRPGYRIKLSDYRPLLKTAKS